MLFEHRQRKSILLTTFLLLALLIQACGGGEDSQLAEIVPSDRLKISVEEAGIQAVTLDDLQDAGLQIDALSADSVALTLGGEPVAFTIDNDALLFYGQASESRYSRERSYILETGSAGLLMETAPDSAESGNSIDSVPQQLRLEQNNEYDQEAIVNKDDEVWFWQTIRFSGSGATFSLDFELPALTDGPTTVDLMLYGATYDASVEGDHDFDLLINDTKIDTLVWDGQIHHLAKVDIPAGVLKSGTNTMTLDNGVDGNARFDIIKLNWINLNYNAPTIATNDRFELRNTAGRVDVSGFSASPLVFNVTDPNAPTVVTTASESGNNVSFALSPAEHVLAVGPDARIEPAALRTIAPNTLRDSEQQADMLIVTTRELAPELDPLVAAREAQGISTVVATVDVIFDEFGFGDASPESITAFARYASENWQSPAPQYLFLVGDATVDPLGNLSQAADSEIELPRNVVPSPLLYISFTGETVADSRIADIDGDLMPDLALGRWPVTEPATVRSLVERTLAYETSQSSATSIFTNDGTSPEFSGFTNRIIDATNFPRTNAEILDGPQAAAVTDIWNSGAWLMTYVGHGSMAMWGQEEVFSIEHIDSLDSSEAPPIVLQFSCLTGQFAHPAVESISETMLKHENGPVLLVAASSLTLSSNQSPFAAGLFEALQRGDITRMGDALLYAKQQLDISSNAGLQEIVDTFSLIGDPSALIVRPDVLTAATDSNG